MLDFLGIGAQKAGTTWLYAMLSEHPQVRFPAGKEVHFWTLKYSRGLEWYRSRFPTADDETRNGEVTPAYAMLGVEMIREFHQLFPELRLLYILRNPIDRAWSSATMALSRSEMQIDEASDQWFIDHFNSSASMARGDYETTILNWQSVFPAEQLLILDYEQIASNPVELLGQVANHCRIDPDFFSGLPEQTLRRRLRPGSGLPLRSSLRPILMDLYKERIHAVGRLLGRDLGWGA